MSKTKLIVDTALAITESLAGSESVQKLLFGEYSDGRPRSLPDALNNEIYSPKQKKNKNDKKKHKKKHKKNKNKYSF